MKLIGETGMQELIAVKDRQPTKTESRGKYRREDQYLCIEIQSYRANPKHDCQDEETRLVLEFACR